VSARVPTPAATLMTRRDIPIPLSSSWSRSFGVDPGSVAGDEQQAKAG
jgi:hypothetical protein